MSAGKVKAKNPRSKKTLYSRLLLIMFLFSLIPTIVITIMYYYVSAGFINEVATELGVSIISQASSELENFFSSITRIGDIAANNQRIQETLQMDFEGDLGKRYSMDIENDGELYFASYLQPHLLNLVVLGDNGGEYKSDYRTFKSQAHKDKDWYKKIQEGDGYTWFAPHIGQFANINAADKVISCGRAVTDKVTGLKNGIVLLDMKESAVREIISTKLGQTGYMIILDENNHIILSPEGYRVQENNLSHMIKNKSIELEKNNDFSIIVDNQIIAAYKEMPSTGWKLMGVIPREEISRGNELLSTLMLVSIAITGALAFFAAYKMSGSIVKPFRKMMHAMKRVESGDLNVKLESEEYAEIRQLNGSFNIMVAEMGALMDNVYKEQKKLRKAEMRALQAQINPHFLYNTLDTILWLNRDGKREQINVIVESMTKLFRIGISRGKDIISIRDEIAHVESYLKIQSVRYGDKFDYILDINEKFMDFQVPKLILQPLVENAIYHGIKLKMGKGDISIESVDRAEYWEIVVRDTGIGIPEDKLESINKQMDSVNDESVSIFGIANVNERIKILFGNEYGLKFDSVESEYTKAILKLPKKFFIED